MMMMTFVIKIVTIFITRLKRVAVISSSDTYLDDSVRHYPETSH